MAAPAPPAHSYFQVTRKCAKHLCPGVSLAPQRQWCWWADITLGASDKDLSACCSVTVSLCDKSTLWWSSYLGTAILGGPYGLKNPLPLCPCWQTFWWGHLASKAKASGTPTEVQTWHLSSSRFFAWSRCSQDFPLWPSKPLNTVWMMSSFIPRRSRRVFKLLCQG